MSSQGFVSLVGAGPGDPELLTLKAVRRLQQADLVVYDAQLPSALLAHCRVDAQCIGVGHNAGAQPLSLEQISQLLVEHGRAGRRVVRLVHGDPFGFSYAAIHAEALHAAGVFWEVVPGVSPASAVPTYAGIPLLYPGLTSTLALVDLEHAQQTQERRMTWGYLALASDTLLLLGVSDLPQLTTQLLEAGYHLEMPVAVIAAGMPPPVVDATLLTIADRVAAAQLAPPFVVLVGEVVRLRERLRWLHRRPLWGRRIIITRAREQAGELASRLRALDALPIEYPVIAFLPPPPGSELDQALQRLQEYDWIIFTSANGVRFFMERLQALGLQVSALDGIGLAVIGPATAAELKLFHRRPDFMPTQFVAEALLAQIGDVTGQRVLLPRADIARDVLPTGLTQKGALVQQVVAYHTVLGEGDNEVLPLLRQRQVDAITFTSSSTVRNFFIKLAHLGLPQAEVRGLLEGVLVAAIGPVTARTAEEYGLQVSIAAERYTSEGLVEALVLALGREPPPP